MPILNYTTKVSIDKTIQDIQKNLIKHGATAIYTEVDDGLITSISFKVMINNSPISFKLPSNWNKVMHVLQQDKKVPRSLCTKEQAIRVAWRILKVWVDAQMAIVETQMVKMEEVFLPYAITGNGLTVYQHLTGDQDGKRLLFDPREL